MLSSSLNLFRILVAAQPHNETLAETFKGWSGRTRAAQPNLGRRHRVVGLLELKFSSTAAFDNLLLLHLAYWSISVLCE